MNKEFLNFLKLSPENFWLGRTAKGTSSAIAIEDLSGIRTSTTVGKGNRYIHSSWSFYQLRSFIEYKAWEAGIPIIAVDPSNTSRECPICHIIDKMNRPERSHFRCISCGLEGEADFIASLNIRNRAAVDQPIVSGAIFDHLIPQMQASVLQTLVVDRHARND